MLFYDLFHETSSALLVNKARSGLTILGIIIGIGSVITMIALGQGTSVSIESRIESLGSNLILITPGATRTFGYQVGGGRGTSQTLTLEDAEAIGSEVSNIKDIAPELSGRYQVTAKGTNTNTSIIGVTSSYVPVRNVSVDTGDFISDDHNSSYAKVAVLGPTTATDLFGEDVDIESIIGQMIRIKGNEFKVIGISTSKGGSGMGNQDDRIYIPLSVAKRTLAGKDYLTTVSVQAADKNSMDIIQEDITNLLLTRHKISDSASADFTIQNQTDILSSASSISSTLTILLACIAGISLVVGGIGIMNMMLTTVTERTREIGLRKAIGAKRNDISVQFLSEAVLITFIGGVVGIILGVAAALLITQFGGITTKISSFSIILAFGVSAAIGIVFGYYPATKAAKLNPIDALRYE